MMNREENEKMRPNIILINCDDLGYGDLGCYGSKKNSTPCIDGLARDGLQFNDFYMASSVCSPSRGAMLTGCYPPRIGFGSFHGNRVLRPGDELGLEKHEFTIAQLLKKADYATKIVGKWHCGDQPEFLPLNFGFDEYYGLPYSNDMCPTTERPDRPPLPLINDMEVIQEQPDQTSLTERYVEKSVDFIKRNKDNPFFLYFAHMHVHLPLYAAPMFIGNSRNGDYGACVAAIDWSTSVLVDTLKTYGLYENTIILFTSDNGSRNDFGESNGSLRGTKGTTWEGGLRVPFIVHWKNHISSGISDQLISSIDLLPSIAKIVGEELPKERTIDGVDQSELILGRSKQSHRDTFFYYMCNTLEAVRYENWKLFVSRNRHSIEFNSADPIDENREVNELYNLKSDPGETHNVFSEYPDVVKLLTQKIELCRDDLGDVFTGQLNGNVRSAGFVSDAKPLTVYDENHPYIIAYYDKNEIG